MGVEVGEILVIIGLVVDVGCGIGVGGCGCVMGGSLIIGLVVIVWLELDVVFCVFGFLWMSIKGVGLMEGILSGMSFDVVKNVIRISVVCVVSESLKLCGKLLGLFGCWFKEEFIGDVWVIVI